MIDWFRVNWSLLAGLGSCVVVVLGVAANQAVQADTIRRTEARVTALELATPSIQTNIAVICTTLADMSTKPVHCTF